MRPLDVRLRLRESAAPAPAPAPAPAQVLSIHDDASGLLLLEVDLPADVLTSPTRSLPATTTARVLVDDLAPLLGRVPVFERLTYAQVLAATAPATLTAPGAEPGAPDVAMLERAEQVRGERGYDSASWLHDAVGGWVLYLVGWPPP